MTRAPTLSVRGVVLYRERMMLPPESVIIVELIDISIADTAIEPIASQVIAGALGPPIPFSLSSPEDIDERHRLAVRACIVAGEGQLLWVTDSPVVVTATDEPFELLLRRS